jgi:hypothetical protein
MAQYTPVILSISAMIMGGSAICIGNAYDIFTMEVVGYIVIGIGTISTAYFGYRYCRQSVGHTIEMNPVQTSMKRNKSDTDLKLISEPDRV